MRKLKTLIVITLCLLFSSKSYSGNRYESEQRFLQKVNLNSTDTVNNIPIHDQNIAKGMFRFIWSFPYINSFYLNPHNENTKNNIVHIINTFERFIYVVRRPAKLEAICIDCVSSGHIAAA